MQSRAEWFALTLHKALAPEDVAARLAHLLPQGMAITRVDVVDKSRRTEQAEAEAFCLSLPTEPENLAAASCFEKFFALSGRMYSRETKNGPRVMDHSPLAAQLGSVERGGGQEQQRWRDRDICG